jgi:hypothetical protein
MHWDTWVARVHFIALRRKSKVDSSSKSQRIFICREVSSAWAPAPAGPRVRLEVGFYSFFIARGWRFWHEPVSLGKERCLWREQVFLGKEKGVFPPG